MDLPVVRLEMRFQIAQRIDSRAATFTDRSSLFGCSHWHLLEHCGNQHFHNSLLEVICCSREGAMLVPSPLTRQKKEKVLKIQLA
jgi:hypothetical protein